MSFITHILMQGTFGDPNWGDLSKMSWSGSTSAPISDYYDIQSADIGSQIPTGFYLREDGNMLFTNDSNETIRRWDLSTSFNLTTASYNNSLGGFTSYDNQGTGIYFKPDGTSVYMIGNQNNKIYRRPLSSAWTTMVSSGNPDASSSLTSTNKRGLYFRSDGKKFYFTSNQQTNANTTVNVIYEYTCNTAWSITDTITSSGSFNQSFTHGNGAYERYESIDFSTDGTKVYVIRSVPSSPNILMKYNLANAWDITSAQTPAQTLSMPTALTNSLFVRLRKNGTSAFLVDAQNNGNIFRIGYS
jgi:sugar lactone lactonase YvrE